MAYQGNLLSKTLVIGIILLLISVAVHPISAINFISKDKGDEPIGLTVHEAWELLNDTSNGIQIPIDVRYDYEWNESFIDTPYPEHPRWYCLDLLQEPEGLYEFIEVYNGEEVILYCNGTYRSLIGSLILCDAGINGTIYFIIGGITFWTEAGYPIRNNTPPGPPLIESINPRARHPTKGFSKNYTFTTIDPDGDKIYLYIDWDDGTFEKWVGPYDSGEEVTITHIYDNQGTPGIKAKAKDIFDAEGPESTHNIPIRRSRQTFNSFFQLLFNRFPLLEVFLRAMNLLR